MSILECIKVGQNLLLSNRSHTGNFDPFSLFWYLVPAERRDNNYSIYFEFSLYFSPTSQKMVDHTHQFSAGGGAYLTLHPRPQICEAMTKIVAAATMAA
jgi:hypothetical protein